MSTAITNIVAGDNIDHEDIPAYVKAEALAVAGRVKAKMQADSIVFLTGSDSHQYEENSTNGQNTMTGNQHAGMAMKALTYLLPFDFAAFLGDYTAGSGTTTLAEGRQHFKHINEYIDEAFRGLIQFRTVGNHDCLGYSYSQNGVALTLEELYQYIGKYNDDGVTVMGSTTSGYCYRDFANKNLRVICLNTADVPVPTSGAESCSDAQKKWFADTLISTPQDYGILILSHHPLDWGSIMPVSHILRAYVEEQSSINIGGTTYSFINKNKSAWVLQIHGHVHTFTVDNIHWNDSGTGVPYDVKRIACPCTNFYRTNEYGTNSGTEYYGIEFGTPGDTQSKVAGGAKDTAFCVYVINPSEQKVYAICYGAGYDREVFWGENIVAVTGISFESNGSTLTVGGTVTLTPIIVPSNATNQSVIWTSSNSSVASVSNGTITALAIGNATITATTRDGGFTASYSVVVEAVPVEPINEIPTSMTVVNPYDATNIYNGVGYKNNTKLGSGGGGDTAATGYVATGVFHIPSPANINYIYVRGVDIDTSDSGCRYAIFGPNSTYESYGTASGNTWTSAWFTSVEKLGTLYYRIACNKTWATSYLISKERYIRFSFKGTGDHLFVSFENPIIDQYYPWGSTVYYTVNNSLNHTTSNNAATLIAEGASYTAILTPDSGYMIDSVSIMMNNTDVTSTVWDSSNHVISIASVTGNITITATSVVGVSYTNLVPTSTDANGNVYNSTGYKIGYRLNSSGNEAESSGSIVSGFMPYNGEVIRSAYFGGSSTLTWGGNYIGLYNASKGFIRAMPGNVGAASTLTNSIWTYDPDDETNATIKSNVLSAKYIRVSLSQYNTTKDFIVTLNEVI